MQSHHQKIWAGQYGGPEGALQKTSESFEEWKSDLRAKIPGTEHISTASDYYSAATSYAKDASEKFKTGRFLAGCLDVLHSLTYLRRAHAIVDSVYRYVPLYMWNADQLDVGASVMFRCRRTIVSLAMAHAGLATYYRNPSDYKPHTEALLRLHVARIAQWRRQRDTRELFDGALCASRDIEEQEPAQWSRIYRAVGMYYRAKERKGRKGFTGSNHAPNWVEGVGERARRYLGWAGELASKAGALDQLKKLKET